MSDDCTREEKVGGAEPQGYRFLVSDVAWTLTGWAAGVCDVTAFALRNIQGTLAGHINLTRNRDRFKSEASLAIENLTNPPQEGR